MNISVTQLKDQTTIQYEFIVDEKKHKISGMAIDIANAKTKKEKRLLHDTAIQACIDFIVEEKIGLKINKDSSPEETIKYIEKRHKLYDKVKQDVNIQGDLSWLN